MLTFWAIGTSILPHSTQVLPSHAVVGLCSMQDVRSFGYLSCRHKSLCSLLRLNTLPCLNHYDMRHTSHYVSGPRDLRERFPGIFTKPYVYCKVFEDNSSALELARLPKLCPRTKHINVCYHHFHEHVRNGLIKIFPLRTKNQIANALTEAPPQNVIQRHPHYMCGL
jgi:hypothetical protein